MQISVQELKFLLKLLEFSDYKASITQIKISAVTKASQRDRICYSLRDRSLIACHEEVTQLTIDTPGQVLLQLDTNNLPIKPQELQVIKASNQGIITPGKINIPVTEKQAVIKNLVERGLIQAIKTKITLVWLTEQGKNYLLHEYQSSQNSGTISLKMLANYLHFLRHFLPSSTMAVNKLTDEVILQEIINLDQQLGTENYLPIFYLRERLQPPLLRHQLDQVLYRLQKKDQIELSSLVEATHYTSQQIRAGIPQDMGGTLFFLSVNF